MNFTKIFYKKSISKKKKVLGAYSLLDTESDKYFIRELISNEITSKKKKLILMCILSSVVYRVNNSIIKTEIEEFKECNESNESKECNETKEIKEFNEICYSLNLHNDNSTIYNLDNQCVFGLFIIQKMLIISFKGSSSLNDFLNNLNFQTVDLNHKDSCEYECNIKLQGKVHNGAYNILFGGKKRRINFIIEKIKESLTGISEIYITGHSLGGLVGCVFHSYITNLQKCLSDQKDNYLNDCIIKLITFGAPRPGNSDFCNSIKNSIRVVNDNDLIPKLPLPINYSHPETVLHIGTKPNINCLFNPITSIDDHEISDYYHNLLSMEI